MEVRMVWLLGLGFGGWLLGCGAEGVECRSGADCASGVCQSDGTCWIQEQDAGSDAGDGADDAGRDGDGDEPDEADGADAGPDGATQDGGDGATVCTPNHDGVIERTEVPIRTGLYATYRVAVDVEVDTAGEPQPDGSRRWDLALELDGDHGVRVELRDPAGEWFAPSFPSATYFTQLRDGENLLGVFQATDSALRLLGVVSPEGGALRTELAYDPPVEVLAFPLEHGSAWSTTSTVSGWASGVWSYYTEKYDNQVDAAGELLTPYGSFEVQRVRVSLTRTVGLLVTRVQSFAFVTECFGTVAAIHSREGETEVEFGQAAEVRRLAR